MALTWFVASTLAPLAGANETHLIDSIGDVGVAPKVRLGLDGLPVIAYIQQIPLSDTRYLKVAKCADIACAATSAVNVVITDGNLYGYDFAVGSDGRPLVLYRDDTGLRLLTCGDVACSANNGSQLIPTPPNSGISQLIVGKDGNPIIVNTYRNGISWSGGNYPNFSLATTTCTTPTCSSSTLKLFPDIGDIAIANIGVALGSDGYPIIVYAEREGAGFYGRRLAVLRCGDLHCESLTPINRIEVGSADVQALAMNLLSDGTPVIAYAVRKSLSDAALATRLVKCKDAACGSVTSTNVIAFDTQPAQVLQGSDGLPVVLLAGANSNGGTKIAKCGDVACGSATTVTPLGIYPWLDMSAVIGPDGKPLIATLVPGDFDLAAVKCTAVACQDASAVPSPGQSGEPLAVITSVDATNVTLIDTTLGEIVSMVEVGAAPEGVAISSDGKRAYITNLDDDSISYLSLTNRVVERTVQIGPGGLVAPRGIAVSPDNSRLYVANSNQGSVSVVDVVAGSVNKTIPVGAGPFGLAVNPQGTRVIVANQNSGTATIIDAATSTAVGTVSVGAQPFGATTSPDGNTAYVAAFGANKVAVIDLATGLLKSNIAVGIGPFGVAASPDGRWLYVSDNANQVSAIDLTLGATVASMTVGVHPQGLDVTPDGRFLYVANQYGEKVSIVDLATRQVIKEIGVPDGPVSLGAFIAGPAFVKVPAIEFYHAQMGHYFMTANADEIAALDQGYFSGWNRTGESWNVWSQGGGLKDVCRFFTVTFAPKSSHFYTANSAECAYVKLNPDWQYEKIAFKVAEPVNEDCPFGVPLYRLYNQGKTGAPNHRYTTKAAIRDQMMFQGYYNEGVAGCVPQ